MAKHLSPPLSRQRVCSSRKYQQRLRWHRLPPSVPMLRICGPPMSPAAVVSAGKSSRNSLCAGHFEEFWVVVDGGYAKKPFLKPARQEGFIVVSRLRKDAALWSLPETVRRPRQ